MPSTEEKSAGIIIYNTVLCNFLVLHYAAGHHDLPKGHIEKGESEKQAAIRELAEETGSLENEIKFIPELREEIAYLFTSEKNLVKKTVVFFLATTKKKEVKVSHEHKKHLWLNYTDAYKRLTYK